MWLAVVITIILILYEKYDIRRYRKTHDNEDLSRHWREKRQKQYEITKKIVDCNMGRDSMLNDK